MAKNIDNTQERNDQEFHSRINDMAQERAAKLREQIEAAFSKATESAKRNRKRKIAREVMRCFFALPFIAGLYLAETAALISPVLADPVYAIAFIYIGWHICKIDRLRGRK